MRNDSYFRWIREKTEETIGDLKIVKDISRRLTSTRPDTDTKEDQHKWLPRNVVPIGSSGGSDLYIVVGGDSGENHLTINPYMNIRGP